MSLKAAMDWEDKELEVANILVGMANGLLLSGQPDGITGETNKRKLIIVIPPKQTQSTPDGNSNAEFPFRIVSFLSAVRVALITPTANVAPRNSLEAHDFNQNQTKLLLPSLTFDQIMQRVRSNPGDGRVLEMTVRLQDLLRGVLRLFLSTKPPPGFFWWRPLVAYDKSTKLWSWAGPTPTPTQTQTQTQTHSNVNINIIPTTPQAWGIRRKILNWLVGCFGEWLNSNLGVLEQIGSLPPPPLSLMPQISPEERYTETRNLKNSVSTLGPSPGEVRAYFQREEALRYSIPEQAFTYTARDGRKSGVVPLKNCRGKPSKKARDHFVLKEDRPPYFTVLCLVRDAAARLPHRSGTRSDICTLVRDSQFVKEDATDCDVKQVVLGALDRLRYELDPCIIFDRDERLWYYLHGDKEEEDFDESCTVSAKRSKY